MLILTDQILNILAPHECIACGVESNLLCQQCLDLLPETEAVCYRCGKVSNNYLTCPTCRTQSPLYAVQTCTPYEAAGQEIIKRLKFDRAISAAHLVAGLMAERSTLSAKAVLVPVPTATSRIRQRGYDQAVVITRLLAKQTGLPYHNFLRRQGQQRQTGSNREQRLSQLQSAFTVKPKLNGIDHVILIDDVLTTGATLEAAARTLKNAGIQDVSAITFARSV